jgi:histidine triad (HIT) family protein
MQSVGCSRSVNPFPPAPLETPEKRQEVSIASVIACPFCDLVATGQSWAILPNSIVVVPLRPVTAGHLLVIPKKHVVDALADPDVTAQTMRDAATTAEGPCNLITSCGRAATQTVWHLHIHIVPRVDGDGLRLPWTPNATRANHPWELQ